MIDKLKYRLASVLKKSPRLYDLFLLIKKAGPKECYLKAYTSNKFEPVSFLQIGANDGLWYDPMRYFTVWKKWRGLMCEPIAESYSALISNYSYVNNAGLEFIQAAVSVNADTELELFRMDSEWLGRQSSDRRMSLLRKTSFNRDHLLKFLREHEADYVISELVPALTLEAMWGRCSIASACPEVLVLDLEGLESDLLNAQDFMVFHPEIILFEHAHMSVGEKQTVFDRLSGAGYQCIEVFPDTIAIDSDIAAQLPHF